MSELTQQQLEAIEARMAAVRDSVRLIKKGFNQREIADKLGLSRSAVCNYMKLYREKGIKGTKEHFMHQATKQLRGGAIGRDKQKSKEKSRSSVRGNSRFDLYAQDYALQPLFNQFMGINIGNK